VRQGHHDRGQRVSGMIVDISGDFLRWPPTAGINLVRKISLLFLVEHKTVEVVNNMGVFFVSHLIIALLYACVLPYYTGRRVCVCVRVHACACVYAYVCSCVLAI